MLVLPFLFLLSTVSAWDVEFQAGNFSYKTVTTENGRLRGFTFFCPYYKLDLDVFLGVRYAKPPVDELRFQKPQPVGKWSGVVNATEFGHSCWQKPNMLNITNINEDCLFLNIFAPSITNINITKSNLKPVMFFIHGGFFTMGNGDFPGAALSANGVVVVTLNYRLGPFGFLYAGNQQAPGNVAIWDMIMALQWVRSNIHHFGGDKNQITVFGTSAGGMAVGHLLVSPNSGGLFKRAILQSGSPFYYTGKSAADSSLNKKDAREFAVKDRNCNETRWLSCLKNLTAKQIVNYNLKWYIDRPIVGDELMPMTAQKLIKRGEFRNDIEVMFGVNENEGTMYGSMIRPEFDNRNVTVTKDQLKSDCLRFNELSYKRQTPNVSGEEIYNFYIRNQNQSDQVGLKRAFSKIFGDFIITCPTYLMAKQCANRFFSPTKYNPVYMYKLTFSPSVACKPWMGVCHGSEIFFVFGFPLPYRQMFSKKEFDFSVLLMHIWANFAKTGNPLPTSPPPIDINLPMVNLTTAKWPAFRTTRISSAVPKAFVLHPEKFGKIITEPFRSDCDDFWESYFE